MECTIKVAKYIRIPGTNKYRLRTETELEQAAQQALDMPALQVAIIAGLTFEEVRKLSRVEQADIVYAVLGRATDAVADFGFDPTVIAIATYDLGVELINRDGGPMDLIRLDPRRVKSG